MKRALLLSAVVLMLAGCSDGPPEKSIMNSPADYACLSPAGQVAVALWLPLLVTSFALLANGFTLVESKRVTKVEKYEEPKS